MNIIMLLVCVSIIGTYIFIQSGRTKELANVTVEEVEVVVNNDNLTFNMAITNKDMFCIGKLFVLVLTAILILDIYLF